MIDEDALYDAIVSGHVAGAALDVQEVEPNFNKAPEEQDYWNKLLDLEQVIFTPHLGASTKEANINCSLGVAKQVEAVLNGELVSAVNMPHISGDPSELKPFISLGEKLGAIYFQAEKERIRKLEIVYSGDLGNMDTKPITLSVVKGLLATIMNSDVNYVNALIKLDEMGIELVESKTSAIEKYTNLITVKIHRKDRTLSIAGTVFARDSIRIVDFFGYQLDFEPTKYVIALQNRDIPGIIGKVGTLLGANNINIAAMQWSRNSKDGKAVSFVSVDSDVPDEIIGKLRATDGILKVSKLYF
jgi:D-3-phosphoglycerate dehydrogenase